MLLVKVPKKPSSLNQQVGYVETPFPTKLQGLRVINKTSRPEATEYFIITVGHFTKWDFYSRAPPLRVIRLNIFEPQTDCTRNGNHRHEVNMEGRKSTSQKSE